MSFCIENGQVLNIRKPIGWSSNDVVRWVKRRTAEKVGHAGTLDPFADGVLLLCIGSATKKAAELMQQEKQYRAVIEFGMTTDTLDVAGAIVGHSGASVTLDKIKTALPRFTGEIEQTPPVFSALRVNGKRAYDLARSGKEVELEKRKVRIYSIDIIDFRDRCLEINVKCAKGVYIRSLARDIAIECGSVGFLRKLTRTGIGQFSIKDSLIVAQVN